jgi:hypothetical protein
VRFRYLVTASAVVATAVTVAPGTAYAAWSKTCLGEKADVVGTSGADSLGPQDTNGDGKYVVLGMGGNDVFWHSFDSGSPSEVYFCGGDGRDTVNGWVRGFNGGSGKDRANLYECIDPVLKSVERRTTPYGCDFP